MLAPYDGIGDSELRANLARFLAAIIPATERLGISMAIHPDDPPFPVLGLPRIVSTASDVASIFSMAESSTNGLCFCTGSFGARPDNDLPAMANRFADRIHALHLRNTRLEADGSFHETSHLTGSTNMAEVLRSYLNARSSDEPVAFRPDHGLIMLDDLEKPDGVTPGYSCIGRMKGLAEIRGLIHGLRSSF
jgi:mannonate dehydratase